MSYEAVSNALCRRVQSARLDLIEAFGLAAVMAEIENKAQQFEGEALEEIGSSDVSCWISDVEEALLRGRQS